MSALLRLIRKPVVTEKAEALRDTENVYTFAVAMSANKRQIAAAVSQAFGVEVDEVRTAVVDTRLPAPYVCLSATHGRIVNPTVLLALPTGCPVQCK